MTADPRTFYRLVQSDPPTRTDMMSHEAHGRSMLNASEEERRLLSGISVFATEAQARRNAKKFPMLGRHLATLVIPDGAPVRIERTRGPGHHTLWGHPGYLLLCVTRVTPAR